jgi:hypothetical protein
MPKRLLNPGVNWQAGIVENNVFIERRWLEPLDNMSEIIVSNILASPADTILLPPAACFRFWCGYI